MAGFGEELRECLEVILGAQPPEPEYDAFLFYKHWLGGRNLGLAPVANAAAFDWPGYWLARVRTADGDHAVVMFGSPSGPLHDPAAALGNGGTIEEEIGGLRFRVRPNAFLQTNTRMAERLYELARAEAGLTGGETVYDLYCGIGTIGLSVARDALTVWGIEISEESVACAIENAELNGIGNAAFFAGNVGQVLRELRDRAGEPDVVVVDPPRAGLAGKALKRLGEIGAPRVVYVSCNPTTLAGDTKRLVEEYGYRLVRTRPVDMVPHTPHIESVSLLERP